MLTSIRKKQLNSSVNYRKVSRYLQKKGREIFEISFWRGEETIAIVDIVSFHSFSNRDNFRATSVKEKNKIYTVRYSMKASRSLWTFTHSFVSNLVFVHTHPKCHWAGARWTKTNMSDEWKRNIYRRNRMSNRIKLILQS